MLLIFLLHCAASKHSLLFSFWPLSLTQFELHFSPPSMTFSHYLDEIIWLRALILWRWARAVIGRGFWFCLRSFCLVEEDFVFHQDFFFRMAQKYCKVEIRSVSFSVLLTDLHGVLTEAAVAAANHVTFRLIRSLAPRSGRGRCLE